MTLGLTGRRRYRSEKKWGCERLILQVEEVVWRDTNCGSHIDSEKVVVWRDAKTTDLTIEAAT